MSEEFRVIGKRPWRPDGVEKVTGRAAYGADFALPGMLFGAVTAPRTRTHVFSASIPARPRPRRGSRP